MSATQKPDDAEEPLEVDRPSAVPDEDGPHDVPDEKVIEKTLPTAPIPDRGKDRRE